MWFTPRSQHYRPIIHSEANLLEILEICNGCFVCFVDLEKAYDRVLEITLKSLCKNGIDGRLLVIITISYTFLSLNLVFV